MPALRMRSRKPALSSNAANGIPSRVLNIRLYGFGMIFSVASRYRCTTVPNWGIIGTTLPLADFGGVKAYPLHRCIMSYPSGTLHRYRGQLEGRLKPHGYLPSLPGSPHPCSLSRLSSFQFTV